MEFFCEQMGLIQAWLAQVVDGSTIRWIANHPSEENHQPPFSEDVVQSVIADGKFHLMHNSVKGESSGLFPLEFDGKIIGLIGLLGSRDDFFKPDVLEWIAALSKIIAQDLFREDFRNKERYIEFSIYRLLQSSLDIQNALPAVLRILAETFHADALFVHALDSTSNKVELLATHGVDGNPPPSPNKISQDGNPINAIPSIWIEDLQDISLKAHRLHSSGFRGYLALPLINHDDLLGILEMVWRSPRSNNLLENSFLERIAGQIASVMERSVILKDLRQTNQALSVRYNDMIEGLSRALELRDFETEGHTRRVSLLTMRLVEHMKIPLNQWEAIRRGTLLHDIGKLGIPDAILLKPGSLTKEERGMMQLHVAYGYNILAPIINSQQTLDIILRHHERWDGTGYPDGMKGREIPLVARLFAVVDVFDALTSDRPYRTAWSHAQAMKYIKGQAGIQFDPQVVEFFLEIASEGL